MKKLESWVCGRWQAGSKDGSVLVNPSTEEPLASASTDGIDMRAVLEHARGVGGPALRKMTFAERGAVLAELAKAIHEHRDALIATAMESGGNTRGDAKFDIDGASGTLAAYAEIGKELGNVHALTDAEPLQIGRSARLFGRHLLVPREGAAVHINAFNFPAWGMCEKAAVAWLAGMPVVTKPATSTALLAFEMAKIFSDKKLLPEGALQVLVGRPGDLLDHLGPQDVLAFTGSSDTGQTIRGGEAVRRHAVRVNVEADSLNAAVLGPDVGLSDELGTLFLNDVCRDMTQKTGQKCTAIRRVYVPTDKMDDVIALLSERLGDIKTGDPRDNDVRMGPVSTAQQLEDVLGGIKKLSSVAKLAFGKGDRATDVGRRPGKGFFVRPTLLRSDKPMGSDPVHALEVFGPVSTVMPYDGSASAVGDLVRAGHGGLVSSMYSDDKSFLSDLTLRLASHHGRLTINTTKVASQALPPGMVLPTLVHGGPGRAGGGEELGGRRGLGFYMQRTALQGDRAILGAFEAGSAYD